MLIHWQNNNSPFFTFQLTGLIAFCITWLYDLMTLNVFWYYAMTSRRNLPNIALKTEALNTSETLSNFYGTTALTTDANVFHGFTCMPNLLHDVFDFSGTAMWYFWAPRSAYPLFRQRRLRQSRGTRLLLGIRAQKGNLLESYELCRWVIWRLCRYDWKKLLPTHWFLTAERPYHPTSTVTKYPHCRPLKRNIGLFAWRSIIV